MEKREKVLKFLEENNGILKLKPAWVAKSFLYSGKRMGLPEDQYEISKGVEINERWLCSVTKVETKKANSTEGLSYLDLKDDYISVREAVSLCPEILGSEYSKNHKNLDYLIKIFDYGCRIPLHLHQRQKDLNTIGKHSKDEAYYFLDANPCLHPETFIGILPYVVKKNLQYKIFVPLLKEWKASEKDILKYSIGYYDVPGEGFYLKSGLLHAPGSALTFELQEASDVGGVFQPVVENVAISKEKLIKDVPPEEIEKYGPELAALHQVDWEGNIDPDFYDKYHLYPRKCKETEQNGIFENWIFYGTPQFSGKRLILKKGQSFDSKENGVHNIYIWKGKGNLGNIKIEAGKQTLTSCEDEFLIGYDRAVAGYTIKNTGDEDLVVFKIFGPDINNDVAPSKIEQGLE